MFHLWKHIKRAYYSFGFRKLCQTGTRKMILVMGSMALMILVFQIFRLSSGGALSPLLPTSQIPDPGISSLQHETSSTLMRFGEFPLLSDLHKSVNPSIILEEMKKSELFDMDGKNHNHVKETGRQLEEDNDDNNNDDDDNDIDLDEADEFSLEIGDDIVLKKDRDPVDGFITLEKVVEKKKSLMKNALEFNDGLSDVIDKQKSLDQINISDKESTYHGDSMNIPSEQVSVEKSSNPSMNLASGTAIKRQERTEIVLSLENQSMNNLSMNQMLAPLLNQAATSGNLIVPKTSSIKKKKKKKKKRGLHPAYTSEVDRLLGSSRTTSHSMRPQWSSAHDRQLLAIRAQIESAPLIRNDRELYAPAFRNISMFKRSYELMLRTLKVYVYKEGDKPIFHQPLLRGIYASEGWFMKLMEGNRHFVVRDPRKAHMFYIPFSSRLLQFALYVPNSHNQKPLKQCLQNYINTIAAKYPFWNRTGGADHFLAACHDWALFETRHTMGRAIRAICNADTHGGFVLGRDVSLPETYVRSAGNPLRDLGGMPANERPTLAFFAGNLHGRLRPILLQHWENKDPDMKIIGPMPGGVLKRKMDYIEHMKNSKYCICPRGYEVNSPRIVESIFYECVPVLISDNYVPPFFEVLNWEAFSVIVPEKDVPRLKEILVSIPEDKYLELQLGVRKVQQHFLWHSKPERYDLFHMTLHSIWYNRLYQIRT